ncbi:hypothetical protein C8T65DRAFT_629230 [Cerioporus squamosus]|nr:hypothetical protein C8T65DRAFT_629230 [Cerioporus squamosus]
MVRLAPIDTYDLSSDSETCLHVTIVSTRHRRSAIPPKQGTSAGPSKSAAGRPRKRARVVMVSRRIVCSSLQVRPSEPRRGGIFCRAPCHPERQRYHEDNFQAPAVAERKTHREWVPEYAGSIQTTVALRSRKLSRPSKICRNASGPCIDSTFAMGVSPHRDFCRACTPGMNKSATSG